MGVKTKSYLTVTHSKLAQLASKLKRVVWRTKIRRIITVSASGLVVLVILLAVIQPAALAAVTVGTSGVGDATKYSQERHTWYDGTRYWSSFWDSVNTKIVFYYSTDGTSWAQNTSASITLSAQPDGFSVLGDSSNIFIVYGGDTGGLQNQLKALQAGSSQSYPTSTSWTWSAAAVTVPLGNNITAVTRLSPVITRDTNNKIVVMGVWESNQPAYTWYANISTNANDISAWSAATGTIVGTSNGGNGMGGDVAPLASGGTYSSWTEGTTIKGKHGVSNTWDTNAVPIAATTASASSNLSMVSSTSANEAYMSYIDSAGKTQFRKYIDNNGAASAKINDAANPGAIPEGNGRSLVRDSTGNLYAAQNLAGICEIWKSIDQGATWNEIDSAHHPTCKSGGAVAIAVDSTNAIHFAYLDASTGPIDYVLIQNDTYGTPETANSATLTLRGGLDIAVDSNNKPHIVSTGFPSNCGSTCGTNVSYNNRVSGSWSTVNVSALCTLQSSTCLWEPNITFANDIPVISVIAAATTTLQALIGNANNAASFTAKAVDITVNGTSGQRGTSVVVDSSGNSWVAYVDATNTNQITLVKHISADVWTTWQTAVTDSKVGSEPSLAVAGNMLYVLYKNSGGAIAQDIYNTDTATWSGETVINSGTTLQNAHVRWALNADNVNKPLDYLYSDGTDIYYNQMGVWRNPVTLDSNSGNAYTSASINTANNDLYIFWIRANTIYYKKCVSPYVSSNCDTNPTTFNNTGTNTWLTSTASFSSSTSNLPVIWTNGTGSPYNVNYDAITFQSPPAAPTLSTPSSGATSQSLVPAFTFLTTDSQSDYIRYRLYLYQSNCSTAVGSSPFTEPTGSPQTGWTGQDAQSSTAYASGTTATYTYQGTLSAGTTYCWKVDATDPGGSNSYSSPSATQLFTTNAAPSAPTLIEPASGQKGILINNPLFRLSTTDADSDYLKYEIQVCSTSNCSAVVNTYCQASDGATSCTGSPTGWRGQSLQSATAYSSAQQAEYQYQGSPLTGNTHYWWRAWAIDPGGTNAYSSASSIGDFWTVDFSTSHDLHFQGPIHFGN